MLFAVVGGLLLWNSMWAKSPDSNGPGGPGTPTPEDALATREIARYWLEIAADDDKAPSLRVVPMVPLKSGQYFKFHFRPNEDGYLYIVGPGGRNKLAAFLTAGPGVALTGLSNNEIRKGGDFSFPTGRSSKGEERALPGLMRIPAPESVYVHLLSYAFDLAAVSRPGGNGFRAERTDETEWKDFLAKYETKRPTIDINTPNSAEPFAAVKLPASSRPSEPVIFDFRIEHK